MSYIERGLQSGYHLFDDSGFHIHFSLGGRIAKVYGFDFFQRDIPLKRDN